MLGGSQPFSNEAIDLKIIFAGTPEFAVPTLQSLLASEHQLVAVLTMPDRPAGRGRKVEASPVKRIAVAQGLPTLQPTTLTSEILAEYSADVMVVVAYGLILAEEILTLPKYGCINLHPSLLPCWRGATPIQSAIFAGNKETGVSVMQMDA
nr:methionyl-tRNA formyltransferase [Gammaproteobacteria bacterium]